MPNPNYNDRFRPSSQTARLLSQFLRETHPCKALICTTCGGIFTFQSRVSSAFPDRRVLVEELKSLEDPTFQSLMRGMTGFTLQLIPSILTDQERMEILDIWAAKASENPWLSLTVLRWRKSIFKVEMSETLVQKFLQCALPAIEESDFKYERHPIYVWERGQG